MSYLYYVDVHKTGICIPDFSDQRNQQEMVEGDSPTYEKD